MCKTSNPGSNDLLALDQGSSSTTLYETIAKLAGKWSLQHKASLGLVVGATDSIALRRAREAGGESVWILTPGVGAQGGSLSDVANYGWNQDCGLLVNSSRGIIYASQKEDFAEQAGAAAQALQSEMAAILEQKNF